MQNDLRNASLVAVLNVLSAENKQLFRSIEKHESKEISEFYGVLFNSTCINEGLLPNYSNFNINSRAVQNELSIAEQRRNLVKNELEAHKERLAETKRTLLSLREKFNQSDIPNDLREIIESHLLTLRENLNQSTKNRIVKKLNVLYSGQICLQNESQSRYLNISQHVLTSQQHDFLSLGYKCHVKTKFDPLRKKAELEVLYDSLEKLQERGVIGLGDNLKPLMVAESTKNRNMDRSNLLTRELRQAAKELRENKEIILRKADKSSSYVIMDRSVYKSKLDEILQDESKFRKITRNPLTELKTKLNKLIKRANEGNHIKILQPVCGEFSLGYIYGNVRLISPDIN